MYKTPFYRNMNIKAYYRIRKLRKALEESKRNVIVLPMEQIRKVGVIWQPSQKAAMNYLRDYFNRDHRVFRTFCVFDELSNPPMANNTLGTNDLDWWGIPQADKISDFTNMTFDLLLNLAPRQNFVLDYITARSKASFKIGCSESEQNFFDLNIKIGENTDALFIAKQQIFYLAQLNKNKET